MFLPPTASSQAVQSVQADDIREAVVRYQIAQWDLNAKVYFLKIEGKDPDEKFLSRFKDASHPVKKQSESRVRKVRRVIAFVEDRKTKQRGVVFDQEAIRWVNETKVDVEGGFYCGSLCMAGGVYRLERRDGRWVVLSFNIAIQS